MDQGPIRARTLSISVEDDGCRTADAARHIVATVPGARRLPFPRGGRNWIGQDAELSRGADLFHRSTWERA